MNEKQKKKVSKFLSLVLRHQPEYIGLELDEKGWANVEEIITKSKTKNIHFSKEELNVIVETNDKKRFALNNDKTSIRANQGHSIKNVDLKLKSAEPPEFLYHGTVEKFIESIHKNGLTKQSRQHVHLSKDLDTALKVGSRRGKPIILTINAQIMHNAGFKFYCSENGVWLTEKIPSEFINF